MFYSQIILAKKGPLGQVWQAAHWGARKLGRPAVFSTDIAAITTSIANPTVPMALRVSGHLLLGIVRIYSRQVQFLLDDCHQAMIKVKMAYSSTNNTGTGENGSGPMIDITVTTRGPNAHKGGGGSSSNNALNISNFGEYNDAATITGGMSKGDMDDYYNSANITTTHFAIPLEELLQRASDVSGMEHTDDDWVPAELDDSTLHISSNLMNISTGSGMPDTSFGQPQTNAEADWGVFDPNDGEGEVTDEEEESDGSKGEKNNSRQDDGSASQVSDIEVTRAVNESTISDPSRRASMIEDSNVSGNLSDKGGDSVMDTTDFPANLDDDDHQQNLMMDSEDDNDSELVRRRTSLRLNNSSESNNEIGISFASPESAGKNEATVVVEPTTKAKKSRRPRKRRKIVTDDGRTELTNDHIRSMLADTSDICRTDLIHPATWIDPSKSTDEVIRNDANGMVYDYSNIDHKRNRNRSLLWNSYGSQPERLFCRPKIGDDGCLSSELLDLWSRNCAPVLNQPFRYELINTDGIEATSNVPGNEMEDDESESSDIEETRNAQNISDVGEKTTPEHSIEPTSEHEFDNNDNDIMPFNDDDDRMPIPDDDQQDNFMAPDSPTERSQGSMESIFSLGATNDADNIVEFEGSTAFDGDHEYDGTATTTSKWHKNTIKVFEVLKKNIISPHGKEDDDDDYNTNKKEFVSYNALSEGVTRRTAAGFFFELLQLKTLNYIELNQPESYGDITISAGMKFHENPPLE